MTDFRTARVRDLNDRPVRPAGRYVLYWAQMFRRLDRNHALDFARRRAADLGKPLAVYEGLKLTYPWASARHHRFILEGMRDTAREARRAGVTYWPFVETPGDAGRGLLRGLAAGACQVVTDDYPAFVVPGQSAALAAKADVRVTAVDGNSVVPLALLGEPVKAAAHLRPRIHRLFAAAWNHRADREPAFPKTAVEPPFRVWDAECDLTGFVASLPIDQSVPPVPGVTGGAAAARATLARFLADKLPHYAEHRSDPDAPDRNAASRLSPYLHYGHVSVEEVVEAVLTAAGPWDAGRLDPAARGKREGFYHRDPNVNSFMDEAVTWRDVGYHWHRHRNADVESLGTALPAWALATLNKHAADPRPRLATAEEVEAGDTYDELWNATQRELVATGRIHNYLRMLWGKKVLEWSRTPDEAYRLLEHLNNKYALDGRDPNSYSGVLWTFGLFDRPWPPERPIFGTVRYMSSDNTAKKFRLKGYLEYVRGLRAGGPVGRQA